MKNNKKAFTLVELIIVVVILSILATVGFISYEEYLVDTRDSKRLAQMTGLRDGLRLGITKGRLPLPDDNVEIRNNSTIFLHQGYAGENVLESISYSEETVDPFDGTYYTYLLSRNRSDFQILGFLEEYNSDITSQFISQTYANDYSQRYPQVMGKKLGIVLEQGTNTPLQEVTEYTTSGYMDLQDTTTNQFDAYITDRFIISGKEDDLLGIIPFTTCKKLFDTGVTDSGIYNINPTGLNPFEVYCNMDPDMDGGGWTLVARSHALGGPGSFGWLSRKGSVYSDDQEYSLGADSVELNFTELLVTSYTDNKDIDYAISLSVERDYIKDSDLYQNHIAIAACKRIYPKELDWETGCDITESEYKRWGHLHDENDDLNENNFYINRFGSSTVSSTREGLNYNGWDGGDAIARGIFFEKQGMLFVR